MNVRSAPPLLVQAALLAGLAALGCDRDPPPGAPSPTAGEDTPRVGSPILPKELASPPASGRPSATAVPAPAVVAPYTGPMFAVTAAAAGVYSEPSFDRGKKLGYIRSGGRSPVEAEPASKKNCTGGWYKVLSGGFVCGNLGTTNLEHPEVKFATAAPNLKEVLPYPYARNAKNGTPLYRSVPSREQMELYEPYLKKKDDEKKPEPQRDATEPRAAATVNGDAGSAQTEPSPRGAASNPAGASSTATPPLPPVAAVALGGPAENADPEPEKPWWQRENIKDRLHEVKLDELSADSDEILAKRMVTGFYVAVDKTFRWNGRSWYKTTRGLVAPSDRFWQTAGSSFKGVELDGTTYSLPLGWVYGGNKAAATYSIDIDAKTIKTGKSIDRFVAIPLTGKTLEFQGKTYVELSGGGYMKKAQLRITEPGPPPEGLGEQERYIDVDLSSQTLVAFEGTRPIYATLISSGKHSKVKDKDHSTPIGSWRIREKHVTTTMDGDGSAAGDLPYSIEDVPYVMYYHRSFALHAAFWHSNFGVQMSHGCVNLSPLDAKWLFFMAGPTLPQGFHGLWSTDTSPGSQVIVHE